MNLTNHEVNKFIVKLEDDFTMLWGMDDLTDYLENYGVITYEQEDGFWGWLSDRKVDPEHPMWETPLRIYWTRPGLTSIYFYVYGALVNENHRYDLVKAVQSYLKHKESLCQTK